MHSYFLNNLGAEFIGIQKTGPRCPEWQEKGGGRAGGKGCGPMMDYKERLVYTKAGIS